MAIEVPVFLVNRVGERDTDNIHCSPCIDVLVKGQGAFAMTVALLDSGATGIYGDPSILHNLNLSVIRQDTVFAVGMEHTTSVHAAVLQIAGLPDLSAEVQSVPCRSAGMPYDIVLGRSFLTMFDFGFDRSISEWKLVF